MPADHRHPEHAVPNLQAICLGMCRLLMELFGEFRFLRHFLSFSLRFSPSLESDSKRPLTSLHRDLADLSVVNDHHSGWGILHLGQRPLPEIPNVKCCFSSPVFKMFAAFTLLLYQVDKWNTLTLKYSECICLKLFYNMKKFWMKRPSSAEASIFTFPLLFQANCMHVEV